MSLSDKFSFSEKSLMLGRLGSFSSKYGLQYKDSSQRDKKGIILSWINV